MYSNDYVDQYITYKLLVHMQIRLAQIGIHLGINDATAMHAI